MESLFREKMHPLKNNNIVKLNFSFNFIIRFTFTNLSSLRAKNWLSFKIILNKIPIVIIKKQRLNIKVVIKSFFL